MSRALLVLIAACSSVHSDDRTPPATAKVQATPASAPVPAKAESASCVDDAKPYDPDVLRARLEALASLDWDGRAPGTDGDVAARKLIVERFTCLGLTPVVEDFEQAFKDANGKTTANVLGMIKGSSKPDEIIVVGAHHDHLGGGYLGANDNASGVVGVLAVAQAVAQLETKPARTIVFATWGAEEQGLIGSTYFLANPPDSVPLANVVQYVNIDMIGSHKSKKAVAAFGAFAKQPSSGVLKKLAPKFPKVNLGIGGHSVRGDHHGFCKQSIPYVFFWTPDARCYHEKCDTAENIDYPRLADIAQIAGGLVIGLGDTKTDLVASKKKIGCFGR